MQLRVLPPKMTVGGFQTVGAEAVAQPTKEKPPVMGPLILGILSPYALAAFISPEEKIYRLPVLVASMAAGSWLYNSTETSDGVKTFGTSLWWGSLASFGIIPFADQIQAQAVKQVANIKSKINFIMQKHKKSLSERS